MPKKGPNKKSKINQCSYDAIKLIINTGAKPAEVRKAFDISPATYYRIVNSKTYQEYRDGVNNDSTKAKAKQRERLEHEKKAQTIFGKVYSVPGGTATIIEPETEKAEPSIKFDEANNQITVDLLNEILCQVKIIAENTRPPRGIFHR